MRPFATQLEPNKLNGKGASLFRRSTAGRKLLDQFGSGVCAVTSLSTLLIDELAEEAFAA